LEVRNLLVRIRLIYEEFWSVNMIQDFLNFVQLNQVCYSAILSTNMENPMKDYAFNQAAWNEKG